MLFDLKFLRSLRLLHIMTRRHFRGEKIGHRKSLDRGMSVEFAEYKEYQPGDDLRFIDWNLYGRLEKLYVKKFHSEEDLQVSIFLDTSASMDFGSPNKFDHARRLAAGIAFIALQNQDAVRLQVFSDGLSNATESGYRPGHIHRLMGFLEKLQPTGRKTDFGATVQSFLVKHRRPGVIFVLSDGLGTADLHEGLKRLHFRGFEVTFVQILAPEEVNPDLAGLVDLIDNEDGSRVSLQISNQILTVYEEVLREELDSLRQFLVQQQMAYQRSLTSTPFETTLLGMFQAPCRRSA